MLKRVFLEMMAQFMHVMSVYRMFSTADDTP